MIAPEKPADETQRLEALRSTRLLDSAPEERFDRITRMARRLFNVPIALVSLVDADRQWFKSKQGLSAASTSREISFCGHAILGDEPFVVENAQQDGRFSDNPLVTGAPSIRFYAGYPLSAADGSKVGTLCLIGSEPRSLSTEDRGVLHALATMVESELAAVDLTTTDAVTGLANLRGFLEVGDYVLRLARKLRHPLHLFLIRVEAPADRGSPSQALADEDPLLTRVTRELLLRFAQCDLMARVGPFDFAVLVSDSGSDGSWNGTRLQNVIREMNAGIPRGAGTVVACATPFDASRHASLEEVLAEAEQTLKKGS